jgi:hypothetical protein
LDVKNGMRFPIRAKSRSSASSVKKPFDASFGLGKGYAFSQADSAFVEETQGLPQRLKAEKTGCP